MALLDIDEIKDWIEDHDAEDANDPNLEALEKRVVGWWDQVCRRQFTSGKVVHILNPRGEFGLVLPSPVTGPASAAKFEDRESITTDYVTVANADLELYALEDGHTTGLIRTDGEEWPVGDRLVRATYTTGYSQTSLPQEVKQGMLVTLTVWWRDRIQQRQRFREDSELHEVRLPAYVLATMAAYTVELDDGFSVGGGSVKKLARHG